MKMKRTLLILWIAILAGVSSACNAAPIQFAQKQVDLAFDSYAATGMSEQDVFVEVGPGTETVMRVTATNIETYMDAPLYGSQAFVSPDPFQVGPDPIGPYAKGPALGFTLAEWLAGSATGTYTIDGDQAYIDLHFERLVPNGVYTIRCPHIYVPPEFQMRDEPCGRLDGLYNTFIADATGKAEFYLAVEPLPPTTEKRIQLIAVVYHSDRKAYGWYTGDFGVDTHVQLLAYIPAPGDGDWQVFSGDNRIALHRHLPGQRP
jgi:hypothetical protein